jgi:CRISPR-associated endonuclease/helicase Cas3
VIATSAGEVGVDLDADHAVLDVVEWERMVQRLGRVNRRGAGEADVWIIPTEPDSKTTEALEKDAKLRDASDEDAEASEDVDGADEADADSDAASDDDEDDAPKRLKDDERARVERWRRRRATLQAIASLRPVEAAFDGSSRAISILKTAHPELVEAASTPAPLHPPLTRAVVESWSMTSLEDHSGRPEVRPWLRGWVEEEAQTAVVWRTWLPKPADAHAYFEAAPVETAEVLETESTAVLTWLDKRAKAALKAHEDTKREATEKGSGEASGADSHVARPPFGPDEIAVLALGDQARSWTIRALVALDKQQRDRLLRSIADATIVVDARLGGLADGLLEPKVNTAARDVSELRRLSFRVREVDDLESVEGDDDWRIEDTFVSRTDDDGQAIAWLLVESDRTQQSTTAEGRSVGREQALAEHQSFAERHARRIAGRLWGERKHTDLLALAAVLHDEGKKAARWQRAFKAPAERRPLAKTTSRPIQSILAGYRHELGSLLYAEADARVAALSADDRDLVLHLIAAHHGFARPLLRTDGCENAPPSALVEHARAIALRFARLERRWGPWGLAWWETLLRAADQAASRENDELGAAHD